MSDCGGRGRGGHGGRAGRGSGGGRDSAYNGGKGKTTKVGLCKDLKGNVFNFKATLVADQMRIMQEKIVQYIGAKYGEDIANELQNKMRLVRPNILQRDVDLPRTPNCACQESASNNENCTALKPYFAGSGDCKQSNQSHSGDRAGKAQ